MRAVFAPLAAVFVALNALAGAAEGQLSHGISIYGDLKYGPNFRHFDYVNPNAPKGGEVRLSAFGTAFDTLNPFTLKGVPAAGLGSVYESLLGPSEDEASSAYGLIAESIEVPEDRSWAIFRLRPEARFHDGTPITPADVIFSFEALTREGAPFWRKYFENVAQAEQVGERGVKFTFAGGHNRELPVIIGQLPVLSKAYFANRDFTATTLEPPLASGPYRVAAFEPGRSITYERVKDYWGAGLPMNVGRNNFDVIRYDYYRDATVAIEAFKAGNYDFRQENTSQAWATAYNIPAVESGRIVKLTVPDNQPDGMQAFVFNTRRGKFADRRVREAIGHAYDFEWSNKNLQYGLYVRTTSFFSRSDMASEGLPSAAERALLEPLRAHVPPEVFTKEYTPPTTDGSGNNRNNLRVAARILAEAGWRITDGILRHGETGEALEIEFLLVSPAFERLVLPIIRNLERLGVKARIRVVDVPQYIKRLETFDFDIIVATYPQSLTPGNEQRDFWSSNAADVPGSRNYAGIKNPAIDSLIDAIIAAPDYDALVTACRALDRVLLWSHYVIPQYYRPEHWLLLWNKFGRPPEPPKYGIGFDSWWVDASAASQRR